MPSENISDDLAPPELRFRYSNFVLIGTGGMGRVLGAHDSLLNRSIAIKLLPRNSENALAVMRFQQEAKAVSKLNNPHVVQVLDFGYTAGGEPYLVMEHVKGSSLESYLDTRGALPILESINIAIQLCDALEHAHANEVIHRDLKPGNVMVEEGNVVKVLDFGLARIANANETDWRLTRPGQPVGSILYMSPEQVRGEESDERSDVFSLGLVILKMVLGQLPFEGKSTLEIVKCRLEEEPPLIPEEADTRFDYLLRIELNNVLRKALAFQPEDRYENMSEFRKALLNAIERSNQIIASEKKADPKYVARKANRDLAILAVVLLVFALSAATYFAVWKNRVDDEKRLSAVHPVIKSSSDAKIRKQIVKNREKMIAEKFTIVGDREHGQWTASTEVRDEDIDQLVGIPITQITFEGNRLITSNGIKTLSTFPIRQLSLRQTDIKDDSMPFVAMMKGLYYLDLQETLVTDAGILLLKNDLNLEYMDVKKDRHVTDRGLLHIIDTFPNLKLLSLSDSGIGPKSFRQIPRLKNLQILRVAALGLTDEDLLSLVNMENLRSLDLQSNPITDKSIETFKRMKLTRLLLEMCTLITQPGMARLQTELKDANITPKPLQKIDADALELLNN